MIISYNPVKFCSSEKTYTKDNHQITEHISDNGILTRRIELDEFGRDVDVKWFDLQGNVASNMHKDYCETANEKGLIETFKSSFQEYTRKHYTKYEAGFKHVIDDYKSKTAPEKNYINEFIYDMQNKLVKLISNGKVTNL